MNSRKLNNMTQNLDNRISKAIAKGCIRIEATAKQLAPVKTGNLRSSISHEVKGLEGVVGTNVEYAPHVELGTHNQKAQPYLFPAFKQHKEQIIKDIADAIMKGGS